LDRNDSVKPQNIKKKITLQMMKGIGHFVFMVRRFLNNEQETRNAERE
jgi:hypothetical protein